jgi:3-oxoacyl-[acyl-carrier-protein] synthase-3
MSFTIIGTGSAYPECVKSNEELSKIMDTSDEWISTRTGIKERHISIDETLSDIASRAARSALEDADVKPEEIDLIICATIRGEYFTPSLACVVQKKIGATCPAFDVNGACSGFIYGLDIAAGFFARKKANKILVIAAEAMSKLVNWKDRSTCVLFGDGAGAAVLSRGDDLLSIKLSASGNTDYLRIPNVNGNCPYEEESKVESYLYLNGPEVYKFAVTALSQDLAAVIEESGLKQEDVDYVIPHQANIRIIEAAKSRLSIPKDRFITNIERFGNTSSVSIPLLLDEMNKEGRLKAGDILAMSAFGGGLTSGACVIRWNKK